METVDVIIPAYRSEGRICQVFWMHFSSTELSGIEDIIVMNTEEKFWNPKWEDAFPKSESDPSEKRRL